MLNMKNIVIEATSDLLYYVHYLENTWIKQWDPGPGPLFLDFVRTNTTMLRILELRKQHQHRVPSTCYLVRFRPSWLTFYARLRSGRK